MPHSLWVTQCQNSRWNLFVIVIKKITHTQFSPVCQSAAVNEDRRRPTENALTCKIGVYSFSCNHVLYMLAKKLATEKKKKKKVKNQTNKPESRIELVHFHPKTFFIVLQTERFTLWFGFFDKPKNIHCISSGSSGGIQRSFWVREINGKSNTGFSPSSHMMSNLCIHE